MSWKSKLAGLFSRKPTAATGGALQKQGPTQVEVVEVNRFGAASDTNLLNRAHWAQAHGNSINNDLASRLQTMQARCQLEYCINPLFEGVVNTFCDDVVGRNGPTLQVVSNSERFNNAVEAAVTAVFADPDPSHRYGGVEVMKMWVKGLMLAGCYLNVNATVERKTTPVTFGWRTLHPRRLVTPAKFAGDPMVAFGCRSNEAGAPVEYYIDATPRQGPYQFGTMQHETYSAEKVQHCYMPVEGEQLTGYPGMASTLDTAADLNQYCKYVSEAAKNAAAHSTFLDPAHPELIIDPEPIDTGSYPISPGEANVAPPGYKWASLDATQPSAQFKEYYRERAAELGRPIHMPGMVVLLSAGDSNFSSAQYEGTVYCDSVGSRQGFIERRSLNPFVIHGIIAELALRGLVSIPKSFELVWTWNVPAHANIEKYAKALEAMMRMGAMAPNQVASALGNDWEKVVAARVKCEKDLKAAGLPPTPIGDKGSKAEPAEEDDEDLEETKTKRTSRARFTLT